MIKKITPSELKNSDLQSFVIIDVREEIEHNTVRIPKSTLIPLSTIDNNTISKFFGKKILVHCKSGKRGTTACEKIEQLSGDKIEIYHLEGGISRWEEEGNEVIKPKTDLIPLERQTHIAIGLFIIIINALGYFVNIKLTFLTLIFGGGLLFAGLTGFCGLAMLIAKMPWNKGSACKTSCTK